MQKQQQQQMSNESSDEEQFNVLLQERLQVSTNAAVLPERLQVSSADDTHIVAAATSDEG